MAMTWLYQNNEKNTARFVLGNLETPLICFGVNPSTAEPQSLDPTMRSVEKITKENHFISWVMLNLYPQRATDPNRMDKMLDENLHNENLLHIESLLHIYPKSTLWAAWGNSISKRKFLSLALNDINNLAKKYDCNWVSISQKTKEGHPRHPLYLDNSEKLVLFDMDQYIKSL